MRIESENCPSCGSSLQRRIALYIDRTPVGYERHCGDCERIWHTSLPTTEQQEREALLGYLADYPSGESPDHDIAWASSMIQAATFRQASKVNAFASLLSAKRAALPREILCQRCGAPIEWGKMCDACCDLVRAEWLASPPDTTRCRYCGAFKDAPGHSEFICEKRESAAS